MMQSRVLKDQLQYFFMIDPLNTAMSGQGAFAKSCWAEESESIWSNKIGIDKRWRAFGTDWAIYCLCLLEIQANEAEYRFRSSGMYRIIKVIKVNSIREQWKHQFDGQVATEMTFARNWGQSHTWIGGQPSLDASRFAAEFLHICKSSVILSLRSISCSAVSVLSSILAPWMTMFGACWDPSTSKTPLGFGLTGTKEGALMDVCSMSIKLAPENCDTLEVKGPVVLSTWAKGAVDLGDWDMNSAQQTLNEAEEVVSLKISLSMEGAVDKSCKAMHLCFDLICERLMGTAGIKGVRYKLGGSEASLLGEFEDMRETLKTISTSYMLLWKQAAAQIMCVWFMQRLEDQHSGNVSKKRNGTSLSLDRGNRARLRQSQRELGVEQSLWTLHGTVPARAGLKRMNVLDINMSQKFQYCFLTSIVSIWSIIEGQSCHPMVFSQKRPNRFSPL